ncbi:hypothetical protein X736_19720 [Mesorhizobium sp. L2C089B000]|nr:hypothetical protein X736_19720 [Mesorhizobium sp. L2C089B000]
MQVARRVRRVNPTGDPRIDTPLVGKESSLFEAMKRAEQAHRDALAVKAAAPLQRTANRKVRKALEAALSAVENSSVNLAMMDLDLDRSYEEPDNNRDLPGLLRRAVAGLKANEHLIATTTDRSLRAPLKDDEGRDVRVKTSGLKALAGVLFDYVRTETDLPWSDQWEEDESVANNGMKLAKKLRKKQNALRKEKPTQASKKKPSALSSMLVYEVARLIDPGYTHDQCSQAMRPR